MTHASQRTQKANAVTIQGLIINTVLCAFKFLAGIVGCSAAMVADAVHSLSDSLTDIVALASVRLSGRPADKDHAYGHGRFETLATLLIALALGAVGAKILYNGLLSILSLTEGVSIARPHAIALIMAGISIIVKEWLYRCTLRAAKLTDSRLLEANAWHHRSDAMSSIGTLLGISGAYFLGNKWTVLDPLAAIVVSFFIFQAAWQIFKDAVSELLEQSLGEQAEKEIALLCKNIPGVQGAHDIKTRKIGSRCAIEMHVYLADELTLAQAHAITEQMEKPLLKRFGPETFVTIHPEPVSFKQNSTKPI